MSLAERIEFWIYKVANPFVKALLRSSYVRENGTVCLLSAHSTRWWMNLREEGTPVSIEIARETVTGKARLWDGDSEALRERVRRYLTALPRDAKVYGIRLDESNRPVEKSLAKVAPELVFVEVELD
jgi:hypothetical protein